MSISHPAKLTRSDEKAFVFARLGGFTCSICAPNSMTKLEVEEFADLTFPGEAWRSVNKEELGLGSPTPNPCNGAPAERTHWFMLRDGE